MTDKEVADKVKSVLIKWFEVDEDVIEPEAKLREDMELDSLDTVDFVVALEKEFGFKVVRSKDEPIIRAMKTVSDACRFVKDKLVETVQ